MSGPHFIAGLPRSGSTLLSAILSQNPRFKAGVTSPVASLWAPALGNMSGRSEFATFFDDDKRQRVLKAIFEAYYADSGSRVVFDTNRTWTTRAALLAALFPSARIICCVRDVAWIIDSLEVALRRNPLQYSRVFAFQPGASIYERVDTLMDSKSGLIGLPWSGLREAWFGPFADKLIIIDYERLTGAPSAVISGLYRELGEREFPHDFNNVVYDEPEYDDDLGMPGLHKVRTKVAFEPRDATIPPDLFAKYNETNFWKRPLAGPKPVVCL